MSKKEILNLLIEIEGQLDDAVNTLPEYNSNVDTRGYIDGARCDLYVLKDEIERSILDENQEVTLDEVMNTSPTLAKLL
jgi:hypothetical protein|tara:strand:+ start:438 stop:674 length:237 start_codon:yes stop_codon:yes gene_type:complete